MVITITFDMGEVRMLRLLQTTMLMVITSRSGNEFQVQILKDISNFVILAYINFMNGQSWKYKFPY